MTNIVRIKRRAAGGAAGAPTTLQNAELAFNEQDLTLYYGFGTGGENGTATQVIAIGGPGAYVSTSGSYANPSWITALAGSKITGDIAGNAGTASALKFTRSISMTGDGTWTVDFDGSGNATGALTLSGTGVTAGTYKSVTVDAKGRVTAGTNPSTLSGYGITDAQPLDGDLSAIAALSGTGMLKRTGDDTWTLDTAEYLTAITYEMVVDALQFLPESAARKGVANGYASLDENGKVPSAQLPSYVDDVVEVADFASLPATGEPDKIYVTLDTNQTYRWGGSIYIEIASSPGTTDNVAEGSLNKYFTEARARSAISVAGSLSYDAATGVISFTAPVTSVAGRTGDVTLTKGDVGLGNVENTALSTWAGSANLNTLGTISTGTWNGSTIAVAYGGTGVTELTGLVKGNGAAAFSAAVAGTDYLAPDSAIDGGTF
jgi:hypothetical protein